MHLDQVVLARQYYFNFTTPDRSRQEMLSTMTPLPAEHWPFARSVPQFSLNFSLVGAFDWFTWKRLQFLGIVLHGTPKIRGRWSLELMENWQIRVEKFTWKLILRKTKAIKHTRISSVKSIDMFGVLFQQGRWKGYLDS